MSNLTIIQKWVDIPPEPIDPPPPEECPPNFPPSACPPPLPPPPPSDWEDLWSVVDVRCSDGTNEVIMFHSPDADGVQMEVLDGSFCYIKHTIGSSSVETEASCDEGVEIVGNTTCSYTSVWFSPRRT